MSIRTLTQTTALFVAALGFVMPALAIPEVNASPAAVEHYNAGVNFFRDGRNNNAVEEFRQAVHLDPSFAEAHANLGYALQGSDPTAAIQQLRLATHLEPTLTEAHNTLGALLYRQHQYPAAAAQYRTVLKLNPNSVAGHYNLSLALAKMGESQEALSELRQTIKLRPGFSEARIDLGQALSQTGHRAEARAQWQIVAQSSDADNAKSARRLLARH